MSRFVQFLFVLLLLSLGSAASASTDAWGVFGKLSTRQWTTTSEPQPRVTRFTWEVAGKVLVARHGLESRLPVGDTKFADTVQRMVLNKASGTIDSTYIYTDGRPSLRTITHIQPNGAAVETFQDKNGIEKRNIYTLDGPTFSLIDRQELRFGSWVELGQTSRRGVTVLDHAANVRQRQADILRYADQLATIEIEDRRRRAESLARSAADDAAAEQILSQGFANAANALAESVAERGRIIADQSHAPSNRSTNQGGAGQSQSAKSLPATVLASPRKLTMFCFAFGQNNLIGYMSQLGSRNVSTEGQQRWQVDMEREFASRSGASPGSVTCHYNETGEQFVASTQAKKDNAALIQWSPH